MNTSDRPSLGTSLKPCIRRLIVYTDTLAEWVYGYVDLAWLCLRIRRLGGSCLRILSTDTTGIHVALGGAWVSHSRYPLAILGSSGGMYSESLDLHATGSLPQCLSLGSLDRYSLCGVVCLCVRAVFFGF